MKRTVSYALVAALALVCVGMVLSVVFPLSFAEPRGVAPDDEQFEVAEPDEFRVAGSIVTDGEPALEYEGVVTADGERYSFTREKSIGWGETYQAAPDGVTYSRYVDADEEIAEQRRETFERDDRLEIVERERTDEGIVTVVVNDEPGDLADRISGSGGLYITSLHHVAYDRTEENDGTRVYRPRSGWYEGSDPYRVSDATGEVRVDPETNAVRSADVSWGLTEDVDTYAEYGLVRLFGDEPTVHEIDYEFEAGDAEIDVPEWVEEIHER